jgi:anti-anti-sigma factor
MTAVLPSVSPDHLPPVVALPALPRAAELLTVTAHPVSPGVVVIVVRGEVDLFTSPLLRERLLAHLRDTASQMIVDLTRVRFFGAAGLAVLLAARQAAMAVDTGLCVVAYSRTVLMPLRVTELDRMFDVYPDLAHALLRLGGGPDG